MEVGYLLSKPANNWSWCHCFVVADAWHSLSLFAITTTTNNIAICRFYISSNHRSIDGFLIDSTITPTCRGVDELLTEMVSSTVIFTVINTINFISIINRTVWIIWMYYWTVLNLLIEVELSSSKVISEHDCILYIHRRYLLQMLSAWYQVEWTGLEFAFSCPTCGVM